MDTVKAGFLGGTLQIVFDMASPTKAEIESVCNKNPLKIAYAVVDSVLFFCIKPNGMDYQDAPFTPHFLTRSRSILTRPPQDSAIPVS